MLRMNNEKMRAHPASGIARRMCSRMTDRARGFPLSGEELQCMSPYNKRFCLLHFVGICPTHTALRHPAHSPAENWADRFADFPNDASREYIPDNGWGHQICWMSRDNRMHRSSRRARSHLERYLLSLVNP